MVELFKVVGRDMLIDLGSCLSLESYWNVFLVKKSSQINYNNFFTK
jgi:hypothetical protein